MLVIATSPSVGRATVDLTGNWYAAGGTGPASLVHYTQTGSALQLEVGGSPAASGTIDAATGLFTLTFPFSPPDCGATLNCQADPTGNTFTGTAMVFVTPPDCHSIFCVCSDVVFETVRGSRAPCGNGTVDAGETCDNANLGRDGDCCALGCTSRPPGASCTSDADPCTSDVCDAAGACAHPTEADGFPCPDGLYCNGQETTCQAGQCQSGAPPCPLLCDETTDTCLTECPSVPLTCRAAGRSLFMAKNTGAPNDKLLWRWSKGAATSQSEFSDPTTDTDYALCIFHGTPPALLTQAAILANPATWSARGSSGYVYDDDTASGPALDRILLRGSSENRSTVLLKNRGGALPGLPLSVTPPFTIQLVNARTGLCWDATYNGPQFLKNASGQIKAKAP